MISNKICNFISFHRSPSQSSDEFENFVYNLDLTLEVLTQKNSYSVIIEDFKLNFINSVLSKKQHLKETSLTA